MRFVFNSLKTRKATSMNEPFDPKAVNDKARDSYRRTAAQFEEFARDAEVPKAMREIAEKNIAQMRETYERSKDALENVMQSWEKSFDAAGQGAVALNRKIIDIAQRNINSSFDLAKSLAGAKNLAEKLWRCNQPIGASSSTHSRPRPKRCAHYQLRWLLMQQSQSKAAFIK